MREQDGLALHLGRSRWSSPGWDSEVAAGLVVMLCDGRVVVLQPWRSR